MMSYAARDSGQFWLDRVRNIYEILNSMHEHGGFTVLCSSWSRAAKEECVVELDKLIGIFSEWKRQLEREISPSLQQVVPVGIGRLAPPRAAHLRAVSPMRTLR